MYSSFYFEQKEPEILNEIVQWIFFLDLFTGSIGINRINAVKHGWKIRTISELSAEKISFEREITGFQVMG